MTRPGDVRSRPDSSPGSREEHRRSPRDLLGRAPSRLGSRSAEDRVEEDEAIVHGALRGRLDPQAQRVQRAQRATEARMRSMYETQQVMDGYSDPWIEAAERAATEAPAGYAQRVRPGRESVASSAFREPQAPKKPLLTEKQQNLVMETLFGQAAPWVQTGLEMAGSAWQSDAGKKVAGVGGLAIGAVLFPALAKMSR